MPHPPVVLIAFNRPQFVEAMIERLREVKPERLFVLSDGPRNGNPTDAERVADVRAAVDAIDWPCDIQRRFSETNIGCDANIELGLDWVFSQVDRAVIFEDDCLPDASFFPYCAELLERYADDERIGFIAGNSLGVPPRLFGETSYGFSVYAPIWGWATWARTWQAHRTIFPRTHAPEEPRGYHGALPVRVGPAPTDRFVTAGGRSYFADVTKHGADYGWDSHWNMSIGILGQLAIAPRANIVANVGFGQDGFSVNSTREMPGSEPTPFPVEHPRTVAINLEVARDLELTLVRSNSRFARTARRLIPQGPLRSAARYVATGPASVWLMRQASRVIDRSKPSETSTSALVLPPQRRSLRSLPEFVLRHVRWAIRSRFPNRKVVREVQGVRLVLPWPHRLPDYAGPTSPYGQNLVALAAALAETDPLTVLDVGANVGDSALQILNATDGRVLCVEADPYYLEYLHLNVDPDDRVEVVEALLSTEANPVAATAVRVGGTTRFAEGESADARPSISAAELRAGNPDFERLRLAKSDTDGYDVELIPVIAEAWQDSPPVLFFEYDHRLSRMAGNDPLAVWPRLAELGYRDVAVWDNGGRALGRTTIDEIAAFASALDGADRRYYWDVAVAHADDTAAAQVLVDLVPNVLSE